MPTFSLNEQQHQIACIVFDKDGTLIDLHLLWGAMIERWVELLLAQLDISIAPEIYHTVGYDQSKQVVIADGILAVSTLPQLAIAIAVVCHQHGIEWHRASRVVENVIFDAVHSLPTLAMLRPIFQPTTLQQLHDKGIKLAILTSDDRAPTEAALRLLNIEHLFCAVGCADDPIACKPDPAGIFRIAELSRVDPKNMLMVGDSNGDMVTGRNAGVAATIGIGATDRLAVAADLVLLTVDDLLAHFV